MYHQVKLWVVLNSTICTTLWSTSQFLISIHFNFSKSPVSVSINNLSDRSSKNFILWDLCRWCHIWEWIFYKVALDSLYTTCKYFLPLRQKLLKALQKEGIIYNSTDHNECIELWISGIMPPFWRVLRSFCLSGKKILQVVYKDSRATS